MQKPRATLATDSNHSTLWMQHILRVLSLCVIPSILGHLQKHYMPCNDNNACPLRAQTKGNSVSPTAIAQQRKRGTETLTNLSAINWIIHKYNSSLYTFTQHCMKEHLVFTSVFSYGLVKPAVISFPHKRVNTMINDKWYMQHENQSCKTRQKDLSTYFGLTETFLGINMK